MFPTSRITWAGRVGPLVGLLAAIAGPVAATQPQDVSIEAHTERGCPGPASCVFAATGAITDAGTVTTDFVRATALPSPTVGTAQYVKTFHGQAGSLTIRLNSMITGTDDPTLADEQGHWVMCRVPAPTRGCSARVRNPGFATSRTSRWTPCTPGRSNDRRTSAQGP